MKSQEESFELGPQYSKDSQFTARMRHHQSWYRAKILKVPYGIGPQKNHKNFYGNMLKEKDGESGCNFINESIYAIAEKGISENVKNIEPFRLKCNMLSSQPMCFNLFGMMVNDLTLATLLWKQVILDIDRVTKACIEYAPEPKSEYLNDGTSFDAFFEYLTVNEEKGFIGIETKLTEPFTQTEKYDKAAYRSWMESDNSPWKPDAWDEVSSLKHNQLWRDHLLAIAMINHKNSLYNSGLFMLIRHPEDDSCSQVVTHYRKLLKEFDKTFVDMPLNKLVGLWKGIPHDDNIHAWFSKFCLRYLELYISDLAIDS
jgi:hypothetical protein